MTTKTVFFSGIGLSSFGAMAAGGYFFLQPTNIAELLASEKIKLLDTKSDQEQWEKLIAKHNGSELSITLADNKTVNVKAIEGLNDITNKSEENIKKLRKKCEELFKKAIDKGEKFNIYKQATKDWCTWSSTIFKEKSPASTSLNI